MDMGLYIHKYYYDYGMIPPPKSPHDSPVISSHVNGVTSRLTQRDISTGRA